jgi:hypothetical protein
MPTNYLSVAGFSVGMLVFSTYQVHKTFQYKHLRQRGVRTTGTVLTAQPVSQLYNRGTHLVVEYLDTKKKRFKARLIAPNSEDNFNDYQAGDEVAIIHHPQKPGICELEEIITAPWWNGPVVPAVLLGAGGFYFLLEAISHLSKH